MKKISLFGFCFLAFLMTNCETVAHFNVINNYNASIITLSRSINGRIYLHDNLDIQPGQTYRFNWWDNSHYKIFVITADGKHSNILDFVIPKGNLVYTIILNEDGVLIKE